VIELNNYIELVEQSLDGNMETLPKLAETIHDSLRSYVFRITLSEDLTDDIVQETILEMYKIFGQLRRSDRFWPWLCRIALNKIRSHSRTQTRRRHLLQKHAEELAGKPFNLDGLANIINKEVKQAIFCAMSKLTDKQKAVLSMRCYEDMPYSQISDVMGVSELSSRLLFHRAKKKLQKHLFNSGFGRKSLVAALVLFGKMTAPSEVAAAQISITSSTLGVGAFASTVAAVTTKTVLTISAGTAITLGLVTTSSVNDNANGAAQPMHQSTNAVVQNTIVSPEHTDIEGYYYYPTGGDGPVMMRLAVSNGKTSYQVLQNDNGNYFLENMCQEVTIRNHHFWNPDMSVMVLPTDSAAMRAFISGTQRREVRSRLDFSSTKDLLIAASRHKGANRITFSVQNYDALMEERFQYNWPADSAFVDRRDDNHRRGWCYFTVDGTFNGHTIAGLGQIPFTWPASQAKPAWFALAIDNKIKLIENSEGSAMRDSTGSVIYYPRQALLAGMNRPWMGLHCIDTVRRDAALSRIAFETELLADDETRCKVSLHHAKGTVEYTIALHNDLIEKISFLDESGDPCGEMLFEYAGTIPFGYDHLRQTAFPDYSGSMKNERIHWLAELASGNL
jgi:RNA polymerase sigma-70 factor (ECF subfamily)